MKTILYTSLTANGAFPQANPAMPISKEVLADFGAHVQKAGCLIIGRRTYELMQAVARSDAYSQIDLVVLSSQSDEIPNVHVVPTPEAALRYLEQKGHTSVVLGGGAAADNAFLGHGLVDELFINILPVLAQGLQLSYPDGKTTPLKLLNTKSITEVITQFHYRLK